MFSSRPDKSSGVLPSCLRISQFGMVFLLAVFAAFSAISLAEWASSAVTSSGTLAAQRAAYIQAHQCVIADLQDHGTEVASYRCDLPAPVHYLSAKELRQAASPELAGGTPATK